MENHLVRKFPCLFPSSFTSCQFRHVPDIVESSIVITKSTQNVQQNEGPPFSRVHTNSSLSKPQKFKTIKNDPKVYKHNKTLSLDSDTEGKRCPPVTPASTLNTQQKERAKVWKIKNSSSSNGGWFSSQDSEVDGETNTFFSLSSVSSESFRMKTAENNKSIGIRRCSSEVSVRSIGTLFSELSQNTTKGHRKFTGNGRENSKICQKTAKACRKTEIVNGEFQKENKVQEGFEVPGIPAELYYTNHYRSCRPKITKSDRKTRKNRRRRRRGLNGRVGWSSIAVDGRVEDSYAVEKTSSDPYSDFKISMVEMIIEKHIFGVEDLERLLHCFLSLNSPNDHKVIVEVFLEIFKTLFTN